MTSTDGSVLPSGTVTFLFLDIERSTELIGQVGAEYPHLLETYRTVTVPARSPSSGPSWNAAGPEAPRCE
jgi:class 3 adenylate cyclase